jgi:hypothetical protein
MLIGHGCGRADSEARKAAMMTQRLIKSLLHQQCRGRQTKTGKKARFTGPCLIGVQYCFATVTAQQHRRHEWMRRSIQVLSVAASVFSLVGCRSTPDTGVSTLQITIGPNGSGQACRFHIVLDDISLGDLPPGQKLWYGAKPGKHELTASTPGACGGETVRHAFRMQDDFTTSLHLDKSSDRPIALKKEGEVRSLQESDMKPLDPIVLDRK